MRIKIPFKKVKTGEKYFFRETDKCFAVRTRANCSYSPLMGRDVWVDREKQEEGPYQYNGRGIFFRGDEENGLRFTGYGINRNDIPTIVDALNKAYRTGRDEIK